MENIFHASKIEELYRFLNEKGLIEIAMRGKDKRFRMFQKVSLDSLQQSELAEKINEAVGLLKQNGSVGEKALKAIGKITKLNIFNLVLNGINLCASVAGFKVMSKKLNSMGEQIKGLVNLFKEAEGIRTDYEFDKVLSDHSDMLDCRKKQKNYSEEEMRKLVAEEFNVLQLLIKVFSSSVTNDRESLVISILSLASMLSVSIQFFDEVYYFNNKDRIKGGEIWHSDHEKWVAVFDCLSSPEFIKRIQDYGFFDLELNTVETDVFYISFLTQIKSLKQEIIDNQQLISAIDDPGLLREYSESMRRDVQGEIEDALRTVGAPIEELSEVIQSAVA